ncbi:antibiotic biosynthesis monooxygenase [Modestobacter muralis]|uniref:Antibiotic biosynthesis monooxygenase n=1 Tax=Modestobacter muralis TaxID=1608614 RepID=A0A6P0ESC2_9ACTN|nr:putative quinol monooxygenase [Modestobacter muralis]NEK93713.1 antibiotic biosynthesis monooxygenase [Modestobacter muralis]NEN50480.1 antibiotic biosynthesis monooxygenase [Modestobacter muralis]
MFSMLVTLQVRPGSQAEFRAGIAANAEASVRDEPGCLRFDVCEMEGDEDRFVFYELYTDAAAFQAHRDSPHFRRWRAVAEQTVVPGSQVNTAGNLVTSHAAEQSA